MIVLRWSFRALLALLVGINAAYLLVSRWDWGSYRKWPVVLVEAGALLLFGYIHHHGFRGSRFLVFPFSPRSWRQLRFLVLAALLFLAALAWRFSPPLAVLFGLLFQYYGLATVTLAIGGTPPNGRRESVPRLAVRLGLSLLLAMPLLEAMSRTWWFGIFRFDRRHSVALRPNIWYGINAEGYRGPSLTLDPEPGTRRILFLGDSSTFGAGVHADRTFAQRTADCLSARAPAHVEALNAGVPGYNVLHLLRRWEDLAAYRPDLVVVMTGFHLDSIGRFLADPAALRARVARFERLVAPFERLGVTFLTPPVLVWMARTLWGTIDPAEETRNRERFREGLEVLADQARAWNVPLVLIAYPSSSVDETVQTIVQEVARERGIPLVDPRARFFAESGQLLMADGLHPSDAGHAAIAEALCARLAESWPSPPRPAPER